MRQWNRDYINTNGSSNALIVSYSFFIRTVLLPRLSIFIQPCCIATFNGTRRIYDSKNWNTVCFKCFFFRQRQLLPRCFPILQMIIPCLLQ